MYLPTTYVFSYLTYLFIHPFICYLLTHSSTYLFNIYLLIYLLPTYLTLPLHPLNIVKKTICKKFVIFIGVNGDEKIFKYNINLTISMHYNIIDVNGSLKT